MRYGNIVFYALICVYALVQYFFNKTNKRENFCFFSLVGLIGIIKEVELYNFFSSNAMFMFELAILPFIVGGCYLLIRTLKLYNKSTNNRNWFLMGVCICLMALIGVFQRFNLITQVVIGVSIMITLYQIYHLLKKEKQDVK